MCVCFGQTIVALVQYYYNNNNNAGERVVFSPILTIRAGLLPLRHIIIIVRILRDLGVTGGIGGGRARAYAIIYAYTCTRARVFGTASVLKTHKRTSRVLSAATVCVVRGTLYVRGVTAGGGRHKDEWLFGFFPEKKNNRVHNDPYLLTRA